MSTEFIKSILDYPFYSKYKSLIVQDLVPKEFYSLYNTIIFNHEHNKVSLNVKELEALHYSLNPTLSNSHKEFILALISQLNTTETFDPKVQESILHNRISERIANELATAAIDLGENKGNYTLEQVSSILDKWKRLKNTVNTEEDCLVDFEKTFEFASDLPWKYNLPDLQDRLGGIGPGYFGIIAGRPDAGKSGFHLSLTASPNGFAEQGAKTLIIGNEEAPNRIKQRLVSSYTGWTKKEILERKPEALDLWDRIKPNVLVKEGFGMTIGQIDAYTQDKNIDILIIDQLDKVAMQGKYATNEERLKGLYIQARELGKKNNYGVFAICQAGFSAHNKLNYGFECLDGSKTGKAAECDFCITIGMEIDPLRGDNGYRMANIPKNKLTGNKQPVPFILEPNISRIHA